VNSLHLIRLPHRDHAVGGQFLPEFAMTQAIHSCAPWGGAARPQRPEFEQVRRRRTGSSLPPSLINLEVTRAPGDFVIHNRLCFIVSLDNHLPHLVGIEAQ
jgi:hypothetical protein